VGGWRKCRRRGGLREDVLQLALVILKFASDKSIQVTEQTGARKLPCTYASKQVREKQLGSSAGPLP